MDRVFINDLRINTIIGIFDWERQVRQTVSFDLDMAHDNRKAADTDDIQFALDYKTVAKRIIKFVEDSEFLLVEKMAEEVAKLVIEEFGVPWLKLTLRKPGALRGARDVGVQIERGSLPQV